MAELLQPEVKNRQDAWREMATQQYSEPADIPVAANEGETTYDVKPKVGVIDAFIKGLPSNRDSSYDNYDPSYQATFGENVASTFTDFARSGARVLAEWTPEYKRARESLDTLRQTDPEAADQIEARTINEKLSGSKLAIKGGAALAEGVLTTMPFFKVGRAAFAAGEAATISKLGIAGETIAKSPLLSRLYSGGLGGALYGGLYGLHTQDADWAEAAKGAAFGGVFGTALMGSLAGLAFAGKYSGNKAMKVFKFGAEKVGQLGITDKLAEVLPAKWYSAVFSVGHTMEKYYGDIGRNFIEMYKGASRLATKDLGKIQLAFIDNGLMEAPKGFGKAFKGVEFVGNDTERMLTYNQILRGQGAYENAAARAAAIEADPKLQFLDGLRKYYAATAQKEGVMESMLNPDTYLPKHTPVIEMSKKTRDMLARAQTQAEREAIYGANDPMVKEMVENSVRYEKAFKTLDEAYGTYYDYADIVNGGSHTPMGDNKMLQDMVRKGQAKTIEEARGKIISDLKLRKQSLTPLAASLDYERQVDLPWYDPNPSRVMPQYVFDASMRIEMAKKFGANDEVIHEMLGSIKADLARGIKADEAAKTFEAFVRQVTGQVNRAKGEEKISATLRALQVPKLAFAQILNLGQSLNTLLASDFGVTMKGLSIAFGEKEIRDAVERGVLTNQFIRQIFEYSSGGNKMADKFLQYSGFTFTEMFNRTIGSTVADLWTSKNLERLLTNYDPALAKKLPMTAKAIVDEAYQSTVKNGGVTISLAGNKPARGIAFAPFKGTEMSVPKEGFTVETIDAYRKQHADELKKAGNHLGIWESEGKIYMDISTVGEYTPETLQKAMNAKQLAAFDLETFTEIPLGSLDKEGAGIYTPLYEAANHPYLNSRKNLGASGAGVESKPGQVSEGAVSQDRLDILERIKTAKPREYWALQELGINVDDVILRGSFTQEEKAVMAQAFVEKTQFLGRPVDLPYFASTPAGKVLFQFKTFAYQQARFITSEMKNQFARKDYSRAFRNLFILSTVFPMTGEVLADVRSLITQDKRPTKALDRYISDIFAAGTYGLIYDFYRAAEQGRTAENIMGATAGDVVRYFENLMQAPGQIARGHEETTIKNFTKNLLRQTGVGRPAVNIFYPSSQPGESTLQSLIDWAAD